MITNKSRLSLICVLLPIIMVFACIIPASAATNSTQRNPAGRITILIESTYDEAEVSTPPMKEQPEQTKTASQNTVKDSTANVAVATTAFIETMTDDVIPERTLVIDISTATFRMKAQHQSKPEGLKLNVKTNIA